MEHPVISREDWLKQRMALLRKEKAVTRELGLLALERQKLAWVEVENDYTLEIPEGPVPFAELFGPYSQLIVYHFMYGPEWSAPCDGCSGWAAACNGTLDQIQCHHANLIAVSRAPIEMSTRVHKAQGWTFQWASSFNSEFNSAFHMSAPPDCTSLLNADELITYDRGESGGINVFVKAEGRIFHTYSAYNRGIQQMNGAFGYVDLLPFGGN